MSTRWRQKCTPPPKTSCLIPLGRCLIHDRPGGVLSLKPLGQQSCLSYVWPMFKKERRMASVKKEGTRERKWTRKSGKNFCVGLAQYGSLDPEAVLSFPEGNENKETNHPPFQTRNAASDFLILIQKNPEGESQCNYSGYWVRKNYYGKLHFLRE